MVALDKRTGEDVWKCRPGRATRPGYSSIVVAKAGGVRQYVQLWRRRRRRGGHRRPVPLEVQKLGRNTANIPTPIVLGDQVFTVPVTARAAPC